MKLALTSDWQADIHNLDSCETALDELLASAREFKPDAIVNAGDLKEAYSPVHVAVVQFWVHAVKRIRAEGFRFLIDGGNHDRVSQSRHAIYWLDILRAAGAETATTARIKSVGDGTLALLPYYPDKETEKAEARKLWLQARKQSGPRVLVFHAEVHGASMNSAGMRAGGNTVEAIRADKYDAAFGGHLHGYQRVTDTVYYIGSPFCHTWGEANERKGHLLVEV